MDAQSSSVKVFLGSKVPPDGIPIVNGEPPGANKAGLKIAGLKISTVVAVSFLLDIDVPAIDCC